MCGGSARGIIITSGELNVGASRLASPRLASGAARARLRGCPALPRPALPYLRQYPHGGHDVSNAPPSPTSAHAAKDLPKPSAAYSFPLAQLPTPRPTISWFFPAEAPLPLPPPPPLPIVFPPRTGAGPRETRPQLQRRATAWPQPRRAWSVGLNEMENKRVSVGRARWQCHQIWGEGGGTVANPLIPPRSTVSL